MPADSPPPRDGRPPPDSLLPHEDRPEIISRNTRQGLMLFLVYFALYMAFLLVNVLRPEVMGFTAIPLPSDRELPLGGPNIAVISGIGLIFAAILLALVYVRATRSRP